MTLSQDDLRTYTTAACSTGYSGKDTLELNGAPQSLESPRSRACLQELRKLRAELEAEDSALPPLSQMSLRLVSHNNFPTAAGLASSAAGFAALVRAVADLYSLPQSPTELSLIARQGSGSACRSLLGGYVAWDMGQREDGSDSRARQVARAAHWPDMRALILVASAEKKSVSSTAGMQTTVATSSLFATRAQQVVPIRMQQMEAAIQSQDFAAFARLTMQDSNSFHACCLDTDPPIFYLNETSRAAIRAVEALNQQQATPIAAYTFDAGPNAVIYYLERHRQTVVEWFRGLIGSHFDSQDGQKGTDSVLSHGVSQVIQTSVGEGPVSIDTHLIE